MDSSDSIKEIESICYAISYQMGEWPTIFETVSGYLDHLLFTIGNGVKIDEGSLSPLIDGIPMHEFPVFDRKAKQLENKDRWLQDIERRLAPRLKIAQIYTKLGRVHPSDLTTDEGVTSFIEKELVKHTYPVIGPDDLTRDSLHRQIVNSVNQSREYEYVRPYPLSAPYSRVYQLTEKSPKGVIWISKEFCHAWFNYLTAELETGNFYKGPDSSYSDEEWTRKHCEAIGELATRFDLWVS